MVAPQSSKSALACTYAALLLHDEGIPVTADAIKKVITAAGVDVEPYWPGLFAQLLQSVKIEDIINNVGSAPVAVAAAPAAGGAAAAAAPAEEKKAAKKEEVEEEDADMGFSLFD